MIPLVVKVKPGVFKDEIKIDAEGIITIKIKQRPIDGAANDYLIEFLAQEFKLRKNDIVLEKGLSSRYKKILLNIQSTELEKILNKYRK